MKVITSFIPELALIVMILCQLLINAHYINDKKNNFPIISEKVIFQTFFALTITLLLSIHCENFGLNPLFCTDAGTQTVKVFVLFFSLPLTLMIGRAFVIQKICFVEFFPIYLLSIVGTLLLISATDLLTAYLALEIQAISFYVLACFNRASSFSTDAGLKYFILGSFVSGFFLMGCLLIYIVLGTLSFNQMTALLSFSLNSYSCQLNNILALGVCLIITSLLFKLALMPFHLWAADVYEGAPMCSTLAISILPKIGILYFFFKIVCITGSHCFFVLDILIGSGCASICVGAYLAMLQNRAKRFFAYSSIAQTGFFALGLGVSTYNSYHALFVFLMIYIASTILIWGFVIDILSHQEKVNRFKLRLSCPVHISTVSNYFSRNEVASLILIALLFSIGGMPPSGGFLAKIQILESLMDSDFIGIAIFVVLVSALSFFYYLRFIKVIFFEIEQVKESKRVLKSTFEDDFSDFFCYCATFGCFCLYLILFFPELLILIADTTVLGTKGY